MSVDSEDTIFFTFYGTRYEIPYMIPLHELFAVIPEKILDAVVGIATQQTLQELRTSALQEGKRTQTTDELYVCSILDALRIYAEMESTAINLANNRGRDKRQKKPNWVTVFDAAYRR